MKNKVNRLNSVCKLIEATEKAVSISAQERVTRLDRLRSLIKEAQLGLILAQLDLKHDAQIQSAVADATKHLNQRWVRWCVLVEVRA
jgi:hypothetical protein